MRRCAVVLKQAQELLICSVLHGKKRYVADRQGRPFCAQAHDINKGRWHGYPVAWKEVPVEAQAALLQTGLVSTRQISDFWEGF